MELIIDKEILHLSSKLKICYHVHRNPYLDTNLSHVNHEQKMALNCATGSVLVCFYLWSLYHSYPSFRLPDFFLSWKRKMRIFSPLCFIWAHMQWTLQVCKYSVEQQAVQACKALIWTQYLFCQKEEQHLEGKWNSCISVVLVKENVPQTIWSHSDMEYVLWIGKIFSVHAVKAYRGSRGIAPLSHNLSTRWRWIGNWKLQSFYPQARALIHIE